jgi:hypothetical protein
MCTFIFGGTPLGRLTQSWCDCGTALASHRDPEDRVSRKVDQLRRKGRSQHRIDRLIEQVQAAEERHEREREAKGADELTQWLDWLQKQPKPIDLFVDDFAGSEPPGYEHIEHVPLAEAGEGFLRDIKKGVLYRFT